MSGPAITTFNSLEASTFFVTTKAERTRHAISAIRHSRRFRSLRAAWFSLKARYHLMRAIDTAADTARKLGGIEMDDQDDRARMLVIARQLAKASEMLDEEAEDWKKRDIFRHSLFFGGEEFLDDLMVFSRALEDNAETAALAASSEFTEAIEAELKSVGVS